MKLNLILVSIAFLSQSFSVFADAEPPTSAASKPEVRPVDFASSLDKTVLHGTLTLPANPKGAVLMIVGSGKADRDETVPGNLTASGQTEKLFPPLSQAAVDAGFATFRYDKRGVLGEGGKVEMEVGRQQMGPI